MQKYFPFFPTMMILLGLCSLIGLNEPLWDQDEAAYFGFSTEMLHTNDWVVPSYPLSEPHRKTALHFWTSALMMKMFGNSHFIFRLMNSIYFLLCGFLVYGLAFYLFSENKKEIACSATLIFFSSIFLMVYQKIALTDVGLLFYSLLGLFCFWKVILLNDFKKENLDRTFFNSPFLWVFGFWISISLGVLQKGPPILILLGGVFLIFFLLSPNRKKLIQFHPWIFLPLALLPLLIWGRLAWIATDGALIRWMIDWYILKRTSGSVFGQSGPPGYYLILFILFLFPWSLYLPKVLVNIKNKILDFLNGERLDRNIFLISWLFSGWIIYEFLPSKLPSYSLSVYPLLCILLAEIWQKKDVPNSEITNNSGNNQIATKASPISQIRKIFPEWKKGISIFIGLIWLTLFGYLIFPQIGIFGLTEPSSSQGKWEALLPIVSLALVLLTLGFVIFQIFTIKSLKLQVKTNKKSKLKDKRRLSSFKMISLGMLLFHFVFAIFYYPSLSKPRDYGSKLASLLLDESSFVKKSLGDLSIIIHPEIRLPSIITALNERGIKVDQIKTPKSAQEIIEKINTRRAVYLAPQSFLSVMQLIGHRPASKCLEFYSYESGKDLNLCWFSNN